MEWEYMQGSVSCREGPGAAGRECSREGWDGRRDVESRAEPGRGLGVRGGVRARNTPHSALPNKFY